MINVDLNKIPESSGVYIFKRGQTIIYIGKSKNLKARLRSHLHSNDPKSNEIVQNSDALEYILTSNNLEAEILESKLIYQHKPYYNIQYKYKNPIKYIAVIDKDEYPFFSVTSKFIPEAKEIFYPFITNINYKHLFKFLGEMFGVRQCSYNLKKKKTNLCIYYYLKLCSGPCENMISKKEYNQNFQKALSFIKINSNLSELILQCQSKIEELSNNLNFEEAIIYRERMKTLKKYQDNFFKSFKSVYLYFIFDMKLLGIFYPPSNMKIVELENTGDLTEVQIIFNTIINIIQLSSDIEIFIQPDYYNELIDFIKNFNKTFHSIKIDYNQINLANDENFDYLKEMCLQKAEFYKRNIKIIDILSRKLGLDSIDRIEVFDVTHFYGQDVYGSMVVFKENKFVKNQYRIFKLTNGFNDYENIHEIIYRRFIFEDIPLPDLVIIDGSKGQLNSAINAFNKAIENKKDSVDKYKKIKFMAIAKPSTDKQKEKLYLYENESIIEIDLQDSLLNFIKKLRDEAHRFANSRRKYFSKLIKI